MSEQKYKYAYEQLLAEHKIAITSLPEDAQIGIKSIKDIEKAIAMAEKKNKKISESTKAKVKAFDKWVVGEILDFVEKTDDNPDKPIDDPEKIIEEIKDETGDGATKTDEPAPVVLDPKGVKIDTELIEMIKTKSEATLEELKTLCPTAYDVIFDTYTKGEENGIKTSHFSLMESGDKSILTKI